MSQQDEKGYLALGSTLLSFSGTEEHLDLLPKVNYVPITRVGDGALYGNTDLKTLRIPESVREVGEKAFSGCTNLETVYLKGNIPRFAPHSLEQCPNLQTIVMKEFPVSESMYQQMLLSSGVMQDGRRIMERFPAIPKLDSLTQSLDAKRAAFFPREITALFNVVPEHDAPHRSIAEEKEFLSLIHSNTRPFSDPESEQGNDQEARRSALSFPEKVCLFGFETDVPPVKHGMRLLTAFIQMGIYYYQGYTVIQWEGKTYYLYQRHYLHSMDSMKYLRRDFGVFTEEGPVNERRLSEEIYAKYKLLSFL